MQCIVRNRPDAPANVVVQWFRNGVRVMGNTSTTTIISSQEDSDRVVVSTFYLNTVHRDDFVPNFISVIVCEAYIEGFFMDKVQREITLEIYCKLNKSFVSRLSCFNSSTSV